MTLKNRMPCVQTDIGVDRVLIFSYVDFYGIEFIGQDYWLLVLVNLMVSRGKRLFKQISEGNFSSDK